MEYEPRLRGVRDAWSGAIMLGDWTMAQQLNERYQQMLAEYNTKMEAIPPEL